MNVPDILGVEVMTPDGRGNILSLHHGRVIVHLNKIEHKQVMKGSPRGPGSMHYSYEYKDVHIIKGQYYFNDEAIKHHHANSLQTNEHQNP